MPVSGNAPGPHTAFGVASDAVAFVGATTNPIATHATTATARPQLVRSLSADIDQRYRTASVSGDSYCSARVLVPGHVEVAPGDAFAGGVLEGLGWRVGGPVGWFGWRWSEFAAGVVADHQPERDGRGCLRCSAGRRGAGGGAADTARTGWAIRLVRRLPSAR